MKSFIFTLTLLVSFTSYADVLRCRHAHVDDEGDPVVRVLRSLFKYTISFHKTEQFECPEQGTHDFRIFNLYKEITAIELIRDAEAFADATEWDEKTQQKFIEIYDRYACVYHLQSPEYIDHMNTRDPSLVLCTLE